MRWTGSDATVGRFNIADEITDIASKQMVRYHVCMITVDEKHRTVAYNGSEWEFTAEKNCCVVTKDDIFSFVDASEIQHGDKETVYAGFGNLDLVLKESISVKDNEMTLRLDVLREDSRVKRIVWPAPVCFNNNDEHAYTLLNLRQGLLIPNTWPVTLSPLPFNGQFEAAGNYMPWYAQIRQGHGLLVICNTPWDSGIHVIHEANKPGTSVQPYQLPSLGLFRYARSMTYCFIENADETAVTQYYRKRIEKEGRLYTLREKMKENPLISRLIGTSWVHFGICKNVVPESSFYDAGDPEENHACVPFSFRAEEMAKYHELGAGRCYIHLDGWADPGYDNCHPDPYPACIEAGGWNGMRNMILSFHDHGDFFGIHDQYRDFYFNAPSFDRNLAVHLEDGSIPEHARWAGGHQTYLCASQALFFVKRNFTRLKEHGITMDGAYLDVFTCNEPDECFSAEHPMTRKQCLEYRGACLRWLLEHGILSSSEEVNEWAMKDLVFCHYAPYDFMLNKPDAPREGIPVPL